MTATPPIFTRAANWAHARPFGCPAGRGLLHVLGELTGPPRVGACTLGAPVALPADWPPGVTVREVGVCWPAPTAAVDVVVLVQAGRVPPRARSRMAAGPALFLHLPDLSAESGHRLAGHLDPATVVAIRARLLAGELHSLAVRHPHLAGELEAVAGTVTPPSADGARITVIGPDERGRREVATQLAERFEVVGDGDVEAVVAVAPPGGWGPADTPTLADAARRVGRLVSTAPLPAEVPGHRAAPGELASLLELVVARPREGPLPEARPGAWVRAVEQLERRRRRGVEERIRRAVELAGREGPAALGEFRALGRELGVGEVPGPERRGLVEPLAQLLLVSVVAGLALGRLLWAFDPGLGVAAGVCLAGALAVVRWRGLRRQRWLRWAGEQATRLRGAVAVDGPRAWLRRTLARVAE